MTHPVLVRRLLAVAAVLTLSLVLTACGGGSDPGVAGPSSTTLTPPTPAPSVATTTASPSSTETTATPSPSPRASGPVALSASAVGDLVDGALDDTSAAHLVVENGLGFLSGVGDIDFRATPSSLAMTLTSDETGDKQAIVVQIVGTTMYLQDGQGFLKIDINSPGNPFGSSLSDQLDPRKVMDVVVQQLRSATDRGLVRSDGETLHVYRLLADGAAVAQQLAPDLAAQESVVLPANVTCDLTTDADGHARSVTLDLGQDNGQLVYTLTDWRTTVSIQAPPASQVSALPDLG